MPPLSERDNFRRLLLKGLLGLPLIPLFSGCDYVQESTVKQKPRLTPTKEEENIIPSEGDVIATSNKFYLLRNGKKYAFNPDEFAQYRRLTKLDKYKRRIFTNASSMLDSHPLGTISKNRYIIDLFTGDLKENRPLGGELNVYFAGFLSDDGRPYEVLIPRKDSFASLRKRLEKDKWNEASSLFFSYGKEKFERYNGADTAIDPRENIKHALEFTKILKEQWPLVQFNFFGKSLGVIFALAAARAFPDAVNNLLLFSGPIRGMRDDIVRDNELEVLNQVLLRLGIIEEVTFYLRQLWQDKTYQRGLDDFTESFKKSGKNIRSIIADNDSIVFPEEAYLPGATTIIQAGGRKNALERIMSISTLLKDHALSQDDPQAQEIVAGYIGENLAAAA